MSQKKKVGIITIVYALIYLIWWYFFGSLHSRVFVQKIEPKLVFSSNMLTHSMDGSLITTHDVNYIWLWKVNGNEISPYPQFPIKKTEANTPQLSLQNKPLKTAISPDNQMLAILQNNQILVYQIEPFQLIHSAEFSTKLSASKPRQGWFAIDLSFSRDNQQLALSTHDENGSVITKVLSTQTWQTVHTFAGHYGVFSPARDEIAIVTENSSIQLYELGAESTRLIEEIKTQEIVYFIVFAPNGMGLYIQEAVNGVNPSKTHIDRLFDFQSKKSIMFIPEKSTASFYSKRITDRQHEIVFSADSRSILALQGSICTESICHWDTQTGELIKKQMIRHIHSPLHNNENQPIWRIGNATPSKDMKHIIVFERDHIEIWEIGK